MMLPGGCELSFSVEPDAWYWPAVARRAPTPPQIIIMAAHPGGGSDWSVQAVQGMAGGRPVVTLENWEDRELALAQAPMLFELLERLRPATLEEVWIILTRAGAADATMRERPRWVSG